MMNRLRLELNDRIVVTKPSPCYEGFAKNDIGWRIIYTPSVPPKRLHMPVGTTGTVTEDGDGTIDVYQIEWDICDWDRDVYGLEDKRTILLDPERTVRKLSILELLAEASM